MRTFSKSLLLLGLLAAFSFAGERIVWHRSYFLSLGADVSLTNGDLDGKGSFTAKGDDGDTKETIYIPYLGSFVIPTIEGGVNINQHTISIFFGIRQPDVNYAKNSDIYTETDANYWRFGAEYRYFFFWPEDFEIGPGLSYAFTRYSVHGAAFGRDKYDNEFREAAVFAGNSFALSANMRYKMRPFGIDVSFSYRGMFIRSVSTDEGGYSSISDVLWQNLFEVRGRIFYEF